MNHLLGPSQEALRLLDDAIGVIGCTHTGFILHGMLPIQDGRKLLGRLLSLLIAYEHRPNEPDLIRMGRAPGPDAGLCDGGRIRRGNRDMNGQEHGRVPVFGAPRGECVSHVLRGFSQEVPSLRPRQLPCRDGR